MLYFISILILSFSPMTYRISYYQLIVWLSHLLLSLVFSMCVTDCICQLFNKNEPQSHMARLWLGLLGSGQARAVRRPITRTHDADRLFNLNNIDYMIMMLMTLKLWINIWFVTRVDCLLCHPNNQWRVWCNLLTKLNSFTDHLVSWKNFTYQTWCKQTPTAI